jgi:hypothetical protein
MQNPLIEFGKIFLISFVFLSRIFNKKAKPIIIN